MTAATLPEADALLDAALRYASAGFFVFPVHEATPNGCACGDATCSNPGKHPRTRHGLHDSTRDETTIRAWWKRWPTASIGIDCDRSGLAVADVDVKKGAQGEATLRWVLGRFAEEFRSAYAVGTPSGGYHYYFAGRVRTAQGEAAGIGPGVDVRSTGNGYVLAPPSVGYALYDQARRPVLSSLTPYRVLNPGGIAPLPEGLIRGAQSDTITFGSQAEYQGEERPAIPYGEHRTALIRIAWNLRRVLGLSVDAGAAVLQKVIESGVLEGYDPSSPFSRKDLAGMLRPVTPNVASGPVPGPLSVLDALVPANEILARPAPPRQIVIDGLMVRGELHVFYGPDGVGKTRLLAYLCALVSRQGRDVLVFISEDQPIDFAITFALSGGDLARLVIHRAERTMREFLLPKCKVDLEQIIQSRSWGAVYFDSINDLKSTDVRLNAADEARQLYGPLSVLAQTYDTAIVCTAHTNARDVLEGARQVRAKARVVARVERPKDEADVDHDTVSFAQLSYDPLWTAVVTTEKFSRGKMGAVYAFLFEERPSVNPRTGVLEHEIQPDGRTTPKMQYVCTRHEQMPDAVKDKLPSGAVKSDLEARVSELVRTCPTFSANDIYRQVGGRKTDVLAAVKRAKTETRA